MAYRLEKTTGDLILDGWENGIGVSPHKGIANMQGVDISTEPGEVMVSFGRVVQSQAKFSGGTLTALNASHLTATAVSNHLPVAGFWINVSASTISNLSTGNYFVYASNQSTGVVQLSTGGVASTAYDPTGANVIANFGLSGTATFSTTFDMAEAVQGATETYTDSSNVVQYRYYVIDTNGRLFVSDTSQASLWNWALVYTAAAPGGYGPASSTVGGMAILNGFVIIILGAGIYTISTVQLGTAPMLSSFGGPLSSKSTPNGHFALVGHQGKLYYCDGNYIGSLFPNTSLDATTGASVNIQSYCSFTAVTTQGTISAVLSGSVPATNSAGSTARIPAFFFTSPGGTQPSNLTAGTKYYIDYTDGLSTYGKFKVYAAASGGAAIDIAAGAAGTQYFNTFFPQSSDGNTTLLFTPENLNLPAFETSTAIGELGSLVIIGTKSNVLYPWNQVDPTPSDLLPMPENGVSAFLTVNNMLYILAGARGNIYLTNGSAVSSALKVPDYCSSGQVEPYFKWGGIMYLRGRVWFSIEDQTSSHTGNCGGVWSFVPTQNFFIGQDTGLSLRMDNRPIDGTFNGYSPVLLASQNQSARGPQYWDFRTSSTSSPAYSINFSDTIPTSAAIIETELIPTGTLLDKKTFAQIEFKLTALADANATETVAISYRKNLTDSFTSLGTAITEGAPAFLSGYFKANFQKTQWLQLQITLTPSGLSTSSFLRLFEIRIR